MPVVGLGTGLITEQDMVTSTLTTAIMAGYRLIDTGDSYDNHRQIAAALKVILPSQGLSRTDMFITTKIHPTDLQEVCEQVLGGVLHLLPGPCAHPCPLRIQ